MHAPVFATTIDRAIIFSPPDQLARRWPIATLPPPGGSVSVARSRNELEDIGRLRYDLYIARDGKAYAHADHARRCFLDAVDDVSLNFQARRGGRLVAAVRLTRAEDAFRDLQLAQLVKAAGLRRLSGVVLNSRFVVDPSPGSRRLIIPLLQQVYRAGLIAGARLCYLATRPQLASIFERFGFRVTGATFDDQVAGGMHVLRLDLLDAEHLVSSGSPLLPIFLNRFADMTSVRREAIVEPA